MLRRIDPQHGGDRSRAFIVLVVALLVGCGKSVTGPTPGQGTTTPTANPIITRVEIAGPPTVAPGEAAQFTLIARLSDGSTRDVTNDGVEWQSRTPKQLSISASGLATGHEPGDGRLYAFYRAEGALNNFREVIVVPAGQYRLTGVVSEAGVPTGPVVGARAEVTSGSVPGLFATTDDNGRYRLFGVAGPTQIRVTKEGYQTQTLTVGVADHQTLNVELPLSAPRADASGSYTLMITAAEECRARLPEQAWHRTYAATVTQHGPQIETTLTGVTFALSSGRGNSFRGRAEPGRVVFPIEGYDQYDFGPYPQIVEQLAPSSYLVFGGTVVAAIQTATLSGLLDGAFQLLDRHPQEWPARIVECYSSRHSFVLAR